MLLLVGRRAEEAARGVAQGRHGRGVGIRVSVGVLKGLEGFHVPPHVKVTLQLVALMFSGMM